MSADTKGARRPGRDRRPEQDLVPYGLHLDRNVRARLQAIRDHLRISAREFLEQQIDAYWNKHGGRIAESMLAKGETPPA